MAAFKSERFENGAVIGYDPLLRKWAVFNGAGELFGWRYTLERAREYAETLPPGPPPEPPPRPIPRSPRALPLEPAKFLPATSPRPGERGEDVGRPAVVHSAAYQSTTGRRYRR